MQVQQFYDYTDMLKANLQSAITIGGKLQFKDDKQYQEFLDAGLIIGSLLVNSESANVYNTSDNTIWNAVEAKVTLWGGNPQTDMNLRHLALVEVLEPLSAPDDILVQIEKVRVVAKFDVVDETKIQFGDKVYVEADPYSRYLIPSWWDSNTLVYRFFVDSVNGSDENNGGDWENAFKSINNVFKYLPSDLGNKQVFIWIAPGTYDGVTNPAISFEQYNGRIMFQWAGTWINDVASMSEGQILGMNPTSKLDAISSDDQIILKSSQGTIAVRNSWNGNKDLQVEFNASDMRLNWNDANYPYHNRFVFKGNVTADGEVTTDTILRMVNLKKLTINTGFTLDLQNTQTSGASFGMVDLRIGTFEVIGGSGEASTVANSQWRCAMSITDYTTGYIAIDSYTWGGADALRTRPVNPFKVSGVRTLANLWGTDNKLELKPAQYGEYLQGSLPDANIAEVRLLEGFSGYLDFESAVFSLEDISTKARKIYDRTTGITKEYALLNQKKVGDSVFMPVGTSVPSDVSLSNKDLVFYMDEATDTLKVKYKDSGGVVQTGEIAVLT